jgi:hypothetical protein
MVMGTTVMVATCTSQKGFEVHKIKDCKIYLPTPKRMRLDHLVAHHVRRHPSRQQSSDSIPVGMMQTRRFYYPVRMHPLLGKKFPDKIRGRHGW